jgi:hypothetical protein
VTAPGGVVPEWYRVIDPDYAHEVVIIGAPPVATGFTHNVPGASRQRIVTLSFVLFTDANAANRLPRIDYNDSAGNAFFSVGAPFSTPANSTGRYSFGIGVMQFGANAAAAIGGPLPDVRLSVGLSISVAVVGIQVGDQVDGISLFVDQWPVRD